MKNRDKFRLIKNLDWQSPASADKGIAKIHYILEQGSLEEMKRLKVYQNALISFNWKYYQELALQREKFKDKIFDSLKSSSTNNYQFKNYQRAVKYKYSLHPLCSKGSLSTPGGRFNVGDVNNSIRMVSALYIAEDKDTALQECLGQVDVKNSELTSQELALTNPQSETIVSVSGNLDYVLDLTRTNSLAKFVSIVKNFKISNDLKAEAKWLNIMPPNIVTKPKQLHDNLLAHNWRQLAALFDIPWNSQIFGNICADAGLQGIVYPSSKNSKKCIVIFPENFKHSDSKLSIDDETPKEVKVTSLTSKNYYESLLSYEQIEKK